MIATANLLFSSKTGDADIMASDVCLEKFSSAEAAAPTFRYDGLSLRKLSDPRVIPK
ncbi:MAG: hypothetical protein RMY34_19810 [Aulosira sp. DedQUE10]|nr:hypothetical protein [Aulosira sp. DedQUE10]